MAEIGRMGQMQIFRQTDNNRDLMGGTIRNLSTHGLKARGIERVMAMETRVCSEGSIIVSRRGRSADGRGGKLDSMVAPAAGVVLRVGGASS